MAESNFEEMVYDRWVWVDLEMTGLDESTCAILEVAMVITDPYFNVIAEIDMPIWQPESILSTIIPYVRTMHTKNGLLERVRASEFSLMQAESEIMHLLSKHVGYKKGVLTGNSIYVDRRFLQRYMPVFEGYLHYRQIDVSSLKILTHAWFGSKARPPKKASSHTALQDIRDSISELSFYRQKVISTLD